MDKNRMRHDVKNALATALLAADSLSHHPEENIRQHARLIIEAIDTTLTYLLTIPAQNE